MIKIIASSQQEKDQLIKASEYLLRQLGSEAVIDFPGLSELMFLHFSPDQIQVDSEQVSTVMSSVNEENQSSSPVSKEQFVKRYNDFVSNTIVTPGIISFMDGNVATNEMNPVVKPITITGVEDVGDDEDQFLDER